MKEDQRREQHGTLRRVGPTWFGLYSTWHPEETGKRVRRQHTVKIGPYKEMSKAQARRALRARVEAAMGP